jgi:hypothetical protein
MPLDIRHLYSAVRILGWDDPERSTKKWDIQGTGFLVRYQNGDFLHMYVVTADHVLAGQYDGVDVVAPDPPNEALYPAQRIQPSEWFRPVKGFDLAIARWNGESDAIAGLTRDHFSTRQLRLAEPVFYVGVLTALGHPVPMVRSGNVAALDVKRLRLEGGFSFPATLVDCRSYDGFSGSAVYDNVPFSVVDPYLPAEEFPVGAAELKKAGVHKLGEIIHVAQLVGMFTNHTTDRFDGYDPDDEDEEGRPKGVINRYGIGVMLTTEHILEALASEEMTKDRERVENELAEENAPPTISGASRKPKRDMDERVSLSGVSAQDALRGLLATPPLDDES